MRARRATLALVTYETWRCSLHLTLHASLSLHFVINVALVVDEHINWLLLLVLRLSLEARLLLLHRYII